MSYDVFISYRRKGSGAGVAGEMQSKLENLGYKVFLDVDSIGSGDFPVQIEQAIQQCHDFLLVLSPGMLERCVDEEDWVRHEIVLAEKSGKNIIGVSLPGFVMPQAESLPAELRKIPEKQVFLWSHEYRNASLEKIVNNMVSTTLKKRRAKRNYLWIGALVVLLSVGIVGLMLKSAPEPKSEPTEDETLEMPKTNDYQWFANAVNDTFSSYVRTSDSLLQLIPENLNNNQDFVLFMACVDEFGDAVEYGRKYPGLVKGLTGVENRRDSLLDVREKYLKRELDAAAVFLDVNQVGFAQFRYENAKIIALPEESAKLDAVGKKLSKYVN